jgi:hypothetical protein
LPQKAVAVGHEAAVQEFVCECHIQRISGKKYGLIRLRLATLIKSVGGKLKTIFEKPDSKGFLTALILMALT